jgi:hypothetical protein
MSITGSDARQRHQPEPERGGGRAEADRRAAIAAERAERRLVLVHRRG